MFTVIANVVGSGVAEISRENGAALVGDLPVQLLGAIVGSVTEAAKGERKSSIFQNGEVQNANFFIGEVNWGLCEGIAGRRLAPLVLRGISDGPDGTLRGSPA
jgi:hypothetical protein